MQKFIVLILFSFAFNFSVAEAIQDIPYQEFKNTLKKNKNCPYTSKEMRNFLSSHFSESDNKSYWQNPDVTIKATDYQFKSAFDELKDLIEDPDAQFLFSSKDKSYITAIQIRANLYVRIREHEKAIRDYLSVWESPQNCFKLGAAEATAMSLAQLKRYEESNKIYLNLYKASKDRETKKVFKRYFKYIGINYPLFISQQAVENYLKLGMKEEANTILDEMLTYDEKVKPSQCGIMFDAKIKKARILSSRQPSSTNILKRVGNEIEPFKSKLRNLNKLNPLKSNSFNDVIDSDNLELPSKERFEKEADYQQRLKKFRNEKNLKAQGIFIHKIDSLTYDVEKERASFWLSATEYLDYKLLGVENYPAQNAFNAKREVVISKSYQNRLSIKNINKFLQLSNFGFNPSFNNMYFNDREGSIYSGTNLSFPLSQEEAKESFDYLSVYLVLKHSFKISNYRDEDPPTYDYPNRFWKKGKSLETEISEIILYNESTKQIINYLTTEFNQEDFEFCGLSKKINILLN